MNSLRTCVFSTPHSYPALPMIREPVRTFVYTPDWPIGLPSLAFVSVAMRKKVG